MNGCTLKEICFVRYNDLDSVVRNCVKISRLATFFNDDGSSTIFLGKTDLSNAFRVLPLRISCICWLVFKAVDPRDGKTKFFVDKCLPFGASISCAHYQCFSNALKHIPQARTNSQDSITNYLDDFLFIAYLRSICNHLINSFLSLCKEIGVLVAQEKTVWATTLIVFLGILLNGNQLTLSIPLEKKQKALQLLRDITATHKTTIKQIQILTGYLNFLTKAIFPGRTFTRRMYAKCLALEFSKSGKKLKQHHHITIDSEFRFDCKIWETFLTHYQQSAVCRPMIDMDKSITAEQLQFFSDASAAETLGFGAVFNNQWLFSQWEVNYIWTCKPNIEYLELFALVAAILTWSDQVKNTRMVLFCDNSAVVYMINSLSSGCKNCMYLLRLLTLNDLVNNRRVFARHLRSEENFLSDALSHLQFDRFWKLAPTSMNLTTSTVSPLVWPASKIWQNY